MNAYALCIVHFRKSVREHRYGVVNLREKKKHSHNAEFDQMKLLRRLARGKGNKQEY